MIDFLTFLRSGIMLGVTYALIAYAFTMTYKSCRAFNFAVGQVTVLAGLLYVSLSSVMPIGAAALAATACTAVLGILIYFVVVRRPDVLGVEPVSLLILLLGISIVIERTIPQIWGYYALAAPPLVPGGFSAGGLYVSYQQVAGFLLAVLTISAVLLFERRTMLGKAMIATGSAREAAITIGINDRQIQAIAWGIAFALLAVAALVITPLTSAGIVSAPRYSVLSISAAFIGGLGKGSGALVGGLAVGIGSAMIAGYWSTEYADAILFTLIVVLLLTRPAGMFGDARALKGARA
ncbi:MAG: branched-chain amino acid ABC transporter permease [Hyphomicrobiaceae bacterium]